eukprot:5767852-Prorocentrum_lima.AAC.1
MTSSLVGSEMCIRDSKLVEHVHVVLISRGIWRQVHSRNQNGAAADCEAVSYTHLTLPTICSV